MKKIILFIFVSILGLGLIGCQTGGYKPTGSIKLEEIEPLNIGDKVELQVTLTSLEGKIEFSSSNDKLVYVDEDGMLTAVESGKATVTASIVVDGKEYSDSIEVEVLELVIKHEHVKCPICEKCISLECDGPSEEKCLGHEEEHEFCEICGKCLTNDCDETLHEKCLGHLEEHDCNEHKSDWQTVGKVECGEYGLKQIICLICNDVLAEETFRQEHDYNTEVLKEKSCTQTGETKYTCSLCSYSYIDYDYANGHGQGGWK